MTQDRGIHKGDTGTVIIVTVTKNDVALDISDADVMKILLGNPDNVTETIHIAGFTTDGSDGKIEFTTLAGTLNAAGLWRIQGYIETPDGEWTTDEGEFVVLDAMANS